MLVVVAHRGEQVGEMVVVEAVVGVSSAPPDRDEPARAEHSKLMRRRALREPSEL